MSYSEVILSESGKELLSDIDEPLLAIHRSQFRHLDAEELENLKRLLKQMV